MDRKIMMLYRVVKVTLGSHFVVEMGNGHLACLIPVLVAVNVTLMLQRLR